ncbi:MAG: hypothetical protein BYD32DRAFT_408419 [Podila humilis]|nr:MAG: hypothetical protein BYD32DRAFT_408419 [Podila humilis]
MKEFLAQKRIFKYDSLVFYFSLVFLYIFVFSYLSCCLTILHFLSNNQSLIRRLPSDSFFVGPLLTHTHSHSRSLSLSLFHSGTYTSQG